MPQKIKPWLPGFISGLYAGRLIGELPGEFNLLVTIALTAVFALVAGRLFSTRPTRHTWPLLLLLVYVLYPTPDPVVALLALAVAAGTWLLLLWRRQIAGDRDRALINKAWPFLLLLPCLLLYLVTLAPDLLPADNGEFQLIGAQPGVAHPPGFPLYTLLAHFITRLPLPGAPAYQINLLSALSSTATLALVYISVYRLTGRRLAAATAVLTLATATTFWAQATTANIRSLTALFAAAMLLALILYRQHLRQDLPQTAAPGHSLIWFGAALGFGLTHHPSLLFMGFIFGLFLLLIDPGLRRAPRRWVKPLLAALVGLLPFLYLPLRANAAVRGASPDLATLSGFLDHVLARGFSGDFFYFVQPAILWERLRILGNVMTFQFHPGLLVGMGAGLLLLMWRRQWRLALLLGGSFAVHTVITATYRAPQTVEYMLPAYVPAVILLGVAAAWLEDRVQQNSWRAALAPLPVLLLLTAVFQGVQRYPSYAALAQDQTARDYAWGLLAQAPPEALILADWHWATPLWYLQEVESQRPDVSVRFVFPEADLYNETWARRIGEGLADGRPVIATHGNETTYPGLLPPIPLEEALLFTPEVPPALLQKMQPQEILLGDTIEITGSRLDRDEVPIGEAALLTVAWQPLAPLPQPLTLFAHLVGTDGRLYAQQDLPVSNRGTGIRLTRFHLTPRLGAAPGTYSLMIGAYGAEPLLDETGEARTAVGQLGVTAMSRTPVTANPIYRPLIDGSRTLVGYDWDNTLPAQPRLYLHWRTVAGYQTEVRDDNIDLSSLPPYRGPWDIPRRDWSALTNPGDTQYVPLGQGIVWLGQSHTPLQSPISAANNPHLFAQQFGAGKPVLRDLVVSVRLIGYEADGFHWAWWDLHDSVPALGAIPTLKWIGGSRVWDPHRLTISEAAVAGQTAGGLLRLYDAFTERPLPILDERITQSYPGIPLGRTEIKKATIPAAE